MSSVDDIIAQEQQTIPEKLDNIIEQNNRREEQKDDKENTKDDKPEEKETEPSDNDDSADAEKSDTKEDESEKEEEGAGEEPTDNTSVDDYGNKIDGSKNKRTAIDDDKLYTKAELNQAINQAVRDRLERFKGSDTQKSNIEERVQEKMQESGVNPNDENAWQKELKNFIKETLVEEENQRKQAEQHAQYEKQIEEDRHALINFQEKFVEGMSRHADFQEVVKGITMTDSMMFAIKDLKDPAGFVRAAAKYKAAEVNRIAALRDPVAQAVAMGRLEESLLVNAKKQTAAPKAISKPKGDAGVKERPQKTVDQLIEFDRMKKYGA